MQTILTDDDIYTMIGEWMTNKDTLHELLRKNEAAVMVKLREQEPQDRERWLAVREGHFNAASAEYFNARQHLDTPENRRIFYAGHCKGYDAAPQPAVVPPGYKLAPVEPTREMVRAGARCASSNMCWAEMLAAAPEAPAQADEGKVVVTWNHDRTRILAVTRQNAEGQILKVIAQAPALPAEVREAIKVARKGREALTVVYRNPTKEEVQQAMRHPKAVWLGWCHAPYERDAALALIDALGGVE